MYKRKNIARSIQRLFQSSFLIGMAMALVATPPVVCCLFADETKSECEEACDDALEKDMKAAKDQRDADYKACDNERDIKIDEANASHKNAVKKCNDDAEAAGQAASVTYLIASGLCIVNLPSGPFVMLGCVAIASAAYTNAMLEINATQQSCIRTANNQLEIAKNAAEKLHENCIDHADETYRIAMARADDDWVKCMDDCDDEEGG